MGTRGVYLPEIELDKAGGYSGHFVADTLRAYLLDQDKSYPSWHHKHSNGTAQRPNDPRFYGRFRMDGFRLIARAYSLCVGLISVRIWGNG